MYKNYVIKCSNIVCRNPVNIRAKQWKQYNNNNSKCCKIRPIIIKFQRENKNYMTQSINLWTNLVLRPWTPQIFKK